MSAQPKSLTAHSCGTAICAPSELSHRQPAGGCATIPADVSGTRWDRSVPSSDGVSPAMATQDTHRSERDTPTQSSASRRPAPNLPNQYVPVPLRERFMITKGTDDHLFHLVVLSHGNASRSMVGRAARSVASARVAWERTVAGRQPSTSAICASERSS